MKQEPSFINCSTSHMESVKSAKVATKICDTKTCMHLNQIKLMVTIAYYRKQRVYSVVYHNLSINITTIVCGRLSCKESSRHAVPSYAQLEDTPSIRQQPIYAGYVEYLLCYVNL